MIHTDFSSVFFTFVLLGVGACENLMSPPIFSLLVIVVLLLKDPAGMVTLKPQAVKVSGSVSGLIPLLLLGSVKPPCSWNAVSPKTSSLALKLANWSPMGPKVVWVNTLDCPPPGCGLMT